MHCSDHDPIRLWIPNVCLIAKGTPMRWGFGAGWVSRRKEEYGPQSMAIITDEFGVLATLKQDKQRYEIHVQAIEIII